MTNPFSLEGKTIFITGASSGIGRATAIEASKLGAKLLITGRNEERLSKTLENLEGEGHLSFIADLTNEEEIKSLVLKLPTLDGVVFNAGIGQILLCKFITQESLDSIMKTNTYSPILLSAELLRKKKIAKNASLVFTASVGGYKTGAIGNGMYGATKAALVGYARSLALELAPRNIRVNTVCPGMTQTPLINGGAISKEELEEDAKQYPLMRYGKPEEVAYLIIYLLSNASSFTTGSNIVIDGGLTIK